MCSSDQCSTGVYHIFFGNATDQDDNITNREILFPQPIVTNKFKLIFKKAATSVVIKMDLLGMPPDKKYESDPVLDPIAYEDCKS